MTNLFFTEVLVTDEEEPDAYWSRPAQLGVLVVSLPDRVIRNKFYSDIRPQAGAKLSAKSKELHKFTASNLNQAPSARTVLQGLFGTVGSKNWILVSWNAISTMNRLKAIAAQTGLPVMVNKVNGIDQIIDVRSIVAAEVLNKGFPTGTVTDLEEVPLPLHAVTYARRVAEIFLRKLGLEDLEGVGSLVP